MIKNVISSLGGVDVYGIISICFFFAFFIGMLIWAFRLKRSYLDSMRELPLDDGSVQSSKTESLTQPNSHHE
jgi:cytochrome c oxidase cbb3-type subunit IV